MFQFNPKGKSFRAFVAFVLNTTQYQKYLDELQNSAELELTERKLYNLTHKKIQNEFIGKPEDTLSFFVRTTGDENKN